MNHLSAVPRPIITCSDSVAPHKLLQFKPEDPVVFMTPTFRTVMQLKLPSPFCALLHIGIHQDPPVPHLTPVEEKDLAQKNPPKEEETKQTAA